MKRSLLACLAGLITWVLVASLLDRLLRLCIPGYLAAEPIRAFTLAMKWARLIIAIVTSVAAGAVTRWLAPVGRWSVLVLGCLLWATFLPIHLSIWSEYPVWYHLTFLLTIVPAVLMGSWLAAVRAR